jgi:hypothetical protein
MFRVNLQLLEGYRWTHRSSSTDAQWCFQDALVFGTRWQQPAQHKIKSVEPQQRTLKLSIELEARARRRESSQRHVRQERPILATSRQAL